MAIDNIENGELASSVRAKLNQALGEASALLDLPNDVLLMKKGGSIVAAPIIQMDQGGFLFGEDIQIPSSSLRVGDLLTLSEGTGFLIITNNVDERQYQVIDGRFDTTGSFRPNQFFLSSQELTPVQTNADEILTANPLVFNYTVERDGQTNNLRVNVNEDMVNVRVRIVDTASGEAFTHLPNRFAWDAQTGGFDAPAGDFVIDMTGSPLRFATGRQLTIEIQADSVSLRGDANGVPFLSLDFQPATFRGMAWLDDVTTLEEQVIALGNSAVNSGRSFLVFQDGFTITSANIANYEDVNAIYGAKNDKGEGSLTRPDINLPNDATIAASGETYPIVFEFTHLGGSLVSSTTNIVRFFFEGQLVSSIQRNQITVVTKSAVGEPYTFLTSSFQQGTTLLPSGVFELRIDLSIANIDNIATQLSGVSINAGDAFIVDGGGERFGATILPRDVIVAVKNSPSFAVNSEDWLVLENGRSGNGVTNEQALFFNQLSRSGVRFDLSPSVFVNPSNVIEQEYSSSGAPYSGSFITPNSNSEQVAVLPVSNLQFTNLVGGELTLEYNLRTSASSGFLPEFRSIELEFNGTTFVFNILNRGTDGLESVTIQIPNASYADAINKQAVVRVRYLERGFQWAGVLQIFSITNRLVGTLHTPIQNLITESINTLSSILTSDIANENNRIDNVLLNLRQINTQLQNPILNLPPSVTSYLKNDISISQQTNTSLLATEFNEGLGDGTNIGLIAEPSAGTPNAGTTFSAAIGLSATLRRGRKVMYLSLSGFNDGDSIVESSTGIPMITRSGSNVVARRFVAAVPSGSSTQTNIPTPANTFTRDWYTIELHTPSLQAEANELFFTNNLPSTSTTLSVRLRYTANGSTGATQSLTLNGVGGSSDVSLNHTLALPDGENVQVVVQWRASSRNLVVEATPNVNNQNFFIFDMQVGLSWTETITTAGSAETFANVVIAPYIENTPLVIAMKPSIDRIDNNAAQIIFVTQNAEVNTGYGFTLRFASNDNQWLVVNQENVMFFDAVFNPNSTTMQSLQAHIVNPFFGLFTQEHQTDDVLVLDTKLQTEALILTSPDGTAFEITITDSGTLDVK